MGHIDLLQSFGRYPVATGQRVIPIGNRLPEQGAMIPRGMGRSYGDVALCNDGSLLTQPQPANIEWISKQQGVVRVSANATIGQLLAWCMPQGWLVPVLPGTQFVSIGGAIANDIHGKNHHWAGSFGCWVHAFSLLRSDGTFRCTSTENQHLFHATVGGLGLTGFIVDAEIQLIQTDATCMRVSKYVTRSLYETVSELYNHDQVGTYSVAWISSTSRGSRLGAGTALIGQMDTQQASIRLPKPRRVPLLQLLAPMLRNSTAIHTLNQAYASMQKQGTTHQSMGAYFFPLDSVHRWNNAYGRHGFVQYQIVVPKQTSVAQTIAPLLELLGLFQAQNMASFVSVVKQFGSTSSGGTLSFPMEGVTMALDFAYCGPHTLRVLRKADDIVAAAGGRVYPAKDACVIGSSFREMYPQWTTIEALREERFVSDFWRRVTA
jgi:FAD/FMN-containing dehydrogenase